MKQMMVINDFEKLRSLVSVNDFQKAFYNRKGYYLFKKVIDYIEGDSAPSEDREWLFRIFIEHQAEMNSDQNFILTLQFFSFGCFALVDIVSFDQTTHSEILNEYLDKIRIDTNPCLDPYLLPIEVYCGKLRYSENRYTNFQINGNPLSGILIEEDINNILSYLLAGQELPKSPSAIGGERIIRKIIEFMVNNAGQDFYEKLAFRFLPYGTCLTSQKIGGLVAMKIRDRCHNNPMLDPVQATVEEFFQKGMVNQLIIDFLSKKR